MAEYYKNPQSMGINCLLFAFISLVQGIMVLYTNRRTELLHELLQQNRGGSKTMATIRQEYGNWHDLAILSRVLALPLIFFIAFILSYAHPYVGHLLVEER